MDNSRSIDRLLQILLVVTVLLCVAGAGLGLFFLVQDLQVSGEFLDGLGAVIGLAIMGLVGVPLALAAWALRQSFRARANAPTWAVAAAVAGALCSIPFWFSTPPLVFVLVPLVLLGVVGHQARPGRLT